MNGAEILQLCRLVKACCPSQVLDEFTPQAWGLILGRYDYEDAKQAVAEMVSLPLEQGKARYVEPGHIIGGIQRIRARRLGAIAMPEPPPGLDVGAYRAWETRTRAQIASGTYTPPPEPKQIASAEQIAALIHQATPREVDR